MKRPAKRQAPVEMVKIRRRNRHAHSHWWVKRWHFVTEDGQSTHCGIPIETFEQESKYEVYKAAEIKPGKHGFFPLTCQTCHIKPKPKSHV